MLRRLPWVILLCVVAAPAAPADEAAPPATQPAEDLKYTPVAPELIEAFDRQARQWAERAREFSPTMHLVETEHFLVFTDWKATNDRPLAEVCEKMYGGMCRQFDIPPEQNIWAGKCPVYIFWEAEHYRRFTTEVDARGMDKAAGYCAWSGQGFVYIVMNRVKQEGMSAAAARTRFYEVLVHEATHGFLARYISHRPIPTWLNEGLADYMAATLVPGCGAAKRHVEAARQAVKEDKSIGHVFGDLGLNAFDYGICQSLVRYLIARDRKGMVCLVTRLKEGRSEAEAMDEAYGLDREKLSRSWREAVARGLRR